MTRGAASAQHYANDSRWDSSDSRVLLTSRNYRGPSLLKTVRGLTTRSVSSESTPTPARNAEMAFMTEEEINALPLSSDEDEDLSVVDDSSLQNAHVGGKRKSEEMDEQAYSRKRTKTETKPTRTSNRRTRIFKPEPEPVVEPELEPIPNSSASTSVLPDFLSQSSQSRKQRATFGKTNSYIRSGPKVDSFADPGDVPATPKKLKGTTFVLLDGTPGSRRRTPRQKRKGIELPESAEKPKEVIPIFKLPTEFGLGELSTASTDRSAVFDVDDISSATLRKRSSSTSSLSSIDSIASHHLNQRQKDELGSGIALDEVLPDHVRCPLCRRIVKTTSMVTEPDPSDLSLRKQQIFCHTHRVSEAQAEWRTKHYPTIDWTLLETKRIPEQTPFLRQVLYHKTPSFYLDSLESVLQEAKGNQSKIRRHLAQDVVEVVKPGYYGPRGAKVMGNAITTEMSNHLKRSLKVDETVRAVGVSGYISAVLLPELLQRIVMEDMGLDDEGKARGVISESTDVGMLLWPDDDHVEIDDEDEAETV